VAKAKAKAKAPGRALPALFARLGSGDWLKIRDLVAEWKAAGQTGREMSVATSVGWIDVGLSTGGLGYVGANVPVVGGGELYSKLWQPAWPKG
jgi:hypothetical protein